MAELWSLSRVKEGAGDGHLRCSDGWSSSDRLLPLTWPPSSPFFLRDQTPEDDDGGDDNSRDDLREPSPRGRSSGSGGFSGEENPRKRPTDENLTAEKRPRSQKSGDPEEISERESRRRRRRSSRDRGDRSGGGGDDHRRRDQRERDDAGERRKRRRRRRRRRSEPSPAPPEPPEKPEDDDRWQLVDGLDEPYGPLYRRRRRK